MDTMQSLKDERDGLLVMLADLQAETDRRVAELEEENAALRERAEAAEAERDDANLEVASGHNHLAAFGEQVAALRARIAELEEVARWRPSTEMPPNGEIVEIRATADCLEYDSGDREWIVFIGDVHTATFPHNSPRIQWRPVGGHE